MGRRILLLFIILFSYLFVAQVQAHPGNTAGDGCHYCRTNCAKWGEVEDERHCHGGSSYTVTPVRIVATPIPQATVTPKPTNTPTPTASPTTTPSQIPVETEVPMQLDSEVEDSIQEELTKGHVEATEPLTATETVTTLGILGGIGWGGFKGILSLIRKFKK